MSNELESDIAMVMNLESFGVDGVGYDTTERRGVPLHSLVMRPRVRDRAAKFDKPTVRIRFQVTQIVRFLLERGLRFRNLGFCGNSLV